MPAPLYLDTARLGQMSPRACCASVDFARFASEHGCSLYLTRLLQDGFSAWPDSLQQCYPGLSDWQGLDGLATQIRVIAQCRPDTDVAVATRSAELMRLAAKLLIGRCRNVLITDLSWPAYEAIFASERRSAACRCTRLNLRQAILRDRLGPDRVVSRIAEVFTSHRCDGLFLPLVDNLGVHLPVPAIVDRLRATSELRFTVIDAAQAIGHVPLNLSADYCDLLLAGCHKWLQAFFPLGLALFGRASSTAYIRDSLQRWTAAGDLDDPLLRFSDEITTRRWRAFGETVNIVPLLTASGAAADVLRRRASLATRECRNRIAEVAQLNGWNAIAPHADLTSRVLLFEPRNIARTTALSEQLKDSFQESGITLSTYENGMIRLSLPFVELDIEDLETLSRGFARASAALRN